MKLPKYTLTATAAVALAFAFAAPNANAASYKTLPVQQDPYDDGAYDDNSFDDSQPYCREFTQTFSIGGERETGYGTACLQPDGSWKIISQDDDKDDSDINYVVHEDEVYVQPREVIFAPGHYWHQRPVGFISYSRNYYPKQYPYHPHRHWDRPPAGNHRDHDNRPHDIRPNVPHDGPHSGPRDAQHDNNNGPRNH